MAIAQNNEIRYQELIDFVLNLIKTKCSNVDNLAPELPDAFKNGVKFVIASQYFPASGRMGAHTNYAYGTVSDETLNVVPLSTVRSQLEEFLSSRGILTKSREIVSYKSIMNFYNNVSSFLATKLIMVTNSFNSGDYIL